MLQVFYGRDEADVSYDGEYINPFLWAGFVAGRTHTPVEAPGTFRNLRIKLETAPGAGTSIAFTLYVNGSPSALTLTIANTDTIGEDAAHDVTVASGDLIGVLADETGAAADSKLQGSIEFEADDVGVSIYGMDGNGGFLSASEARYLSLFTTNLIYDDPLNAEQIVAAPGSVTRYRVIGDDAPGAGKDYTFVIVKNGVDQDGTGGTTDTTLVLADANTTATWTGNLALVAGDLVYLKRTPHNTPALQRNALGVKFVATTDGQYNICGLTDELIHATDTQYFNPVLATSGVGPTTIEGSHEVYGGTSTIVVGGLRVRLSTAPGAGKTRTIALRLDAADPASGPSVTISGTSTTGADLVGTATITATNEWALKSVPTGTAAASRAAWSLIGGATPGGGGGGGGGRAWVFVGPMSGAVFAG